MITTVQPTIKKYLDKFRRDNVTPSQSEEEVYWEIYEIGAEYVRRMNMPEEDKRDLLRNKMFWDWLRGLIYLKDNVLFTDRYFSEKKMSVSLYWKIQLHHLLRFKVNSVVMNNTVIAEDCSL